MPKGRGHPTSNIEWWWEDDLEASADVCAWRGPAKGGSANGAKQTESRFEMFKAKTGLTRNDLK